MTDRWRCKSIPTNCLPSYSSIGASYDSWNVNTPASAGNVTRSGGPAPSSHQVCVNHHVTLVPATRSGGDFGGVRTGLLGAGAECRMDRTGSFTVGYIIGSLSVAVDEP